MSTLNIENQKLFEKLKDQLLMYDPVYFGERYLTLDGKKFSLSHNGYKPFAEIYRYIGIKALELDAKPIIMVKGRQVGATTMASVLEMYFMGSGLFGVGDRPPIRIIHAFPQLELAAAYSKTKLNQMIVSSESIPDPEGKKSSKSKSYMQNLLDQSAATNDSLHFKQFMGGNHLWIESVGLDGDRIMGRTADVLFFDECFPSYQMISTDNGKISIGSLYKKWVKQQELPLIYSFNLSSGQFEYSKVLNVWQRQKTPVIELIISGRKITCTKNHKFLTQFGWLEADKIEIGTLIKSSINTTKYVRDLNDDQYQVILGSFLGDGHFSSCGTSRFRLSVIHGLNQEQYCKWKSNLLDAPVSYIHKNGFSKKPAYKFCTKLFGLNKDIPIQKSYCPQWILDDLDARGLAVWWMDDGSINNSWNEDNSGRISTCSFDEDSQRRMVKKLKEFGIDCHYKMYEGYFYILINKDGFRKLQEIIKPYVHPSMSYKINNVVGNYVWSSSYNNYSWLVLDRKIDKNSSEIVYDLEVENNHNFILAPNGKGRNVGGPIVHNCQKTTGMAIGNSLKVLTTAKYGKPSKGVQVYFGTPRRKGSDFYKMWQTSSQQYYYLGCEKCKEHFPLYTPGSDDWKTIWIYGHIVKCTHCGHEQDKRQAAERGKWISFNNPDDPDCQMIGFHINQLYMPMFTREDIDNEMPGKHPINTERVFQNEVLGEFYQGDASPITPEEIRELCADEGRKFSPSIIPARNTIDPQLIVLGIDYGARADLEQLGDPDRVKAVGQSYSTAVVLQAKGPNLLSIEFATKFKRNDPASKRGLIDQIMRQYSIQLAIGDIGYSNDFSQDLYNIYNDRYMVSRAHPRVNEHVKFAADRFPKELIFERDYYIGELYEQMKKGMIRFPFGDYEKIGWLIEHCASMEKTSSISKYGDPTVHYIKGGTPNDGFMALLNAYIAYKFIITKGFTNNNPLLQQQNFGNHKKVLAITGFIPRKF